MGPLVWITWPGLITAFCGFALLLDGYWRLMGGQPVRRLGTYLFALAFIAVGVWGVWFVHDYDESGCWDTPNCGWDAGFYVIPLVWFGLSVAAGMYWLVTRRMGNSEEPAQRGLSA